MAVCLAGCDFLFVTVWVTRSQIENHFRLNTRPLASSNANLERLYTGYANHMKDDFSHGLCDRSQFCACYSQEIYRASDDAGIVVLQTAEESWQ